MGVFNQSAFPQRGKRRSFQVIKGSSHNDASIDRLYQARFAQSSSSFFLNVRRLSTAANLRSDRKQREPAKKIFVPFPIASVIVKPSASRTLPFLHSLFAVRPMFEATLNLTDPRIALVLLGTQDQHLKTIRRHLQVSITHQDGRIRIAGEQQPAVSQAAEALEQLKKRAERQQSLASEEVARTLAEITGEEVPLEQTTIDVVHTNKTVVPRTPGQKDYVESMRRHDVVFSLGPAGCGKTYLAVAAAVEALKHHQIRKIVLVRPAVEAGAYYRNFSLLSQLQQAVSSTPSRIGFNGTPF